MYSSPSTQLYALGRGALSIGEWSGDAPPGSLTDVGNCPRFEVEVTEEKLNHFSSRSGLKVMDKQVVLETGYTVNFDLDEISLLNMRMFLKATVGATANVLRANTALDKEYAVKFASDKPTGLNETWEFHKATLSPGGAFNLLSDEWQLLSFTGDGLADEANNPNSPYFDVTFATTTTTTTTTSTSTTSTSTTTTTT